MTILIVNIQGQIPRSLFKHINDAIFNGNEKYKIRMKHCDNKHELWVQISTVLASFKLF